MKNDVRRKIYKYHDLSPQIDSVIGLPFIIEDNSRTLLMRMIGQMETYQTMMGFERPDETLSLLVERLATVDRCVEYLTSMHNLDKDDIVIRVCLSYVMDADNKPHQILTTSVRCPLNDGTLAYTQPSIQLFLNTHKTMWDDSFMESYPEPPLKPAVKPSSYSLTANYRLK